MAADKKYRIRFFIEWAGADYLWSENEHAYEVYGLGPIQNRLPLSDGLRQRGIEVSNWYHSSLNWGSPNDPGPWRQEECDRFKIAVRAFFEDLKVELGEDYELIYRQYEPDEDPDLDEYLKDPKNFKRKR